MTITEFLEARIAEDEAVARAAVRSGDGIWTAGEVFDGDDTVYDPCGVYGDDIHIYDEGGHDENHADHIARHDPARVLADCAAKRAIINNSADAQPRYMDDPHWNGFNDCHESALYSLAAVYASHPDYESGWGL